MKEAKKESTSTGHAFSLDRGLYRKPVTGHIFRDDETGEVTGCSFDHLSTVWNPAGIISVYMQLAGRGRHLTISDLSKEFHDSGEALLIEYVTSIVIPRERTNAVQQAEEELYIAEHGKLPFELPGYGHGV